MITHNTDAYTRYKNTQNARNHILSSGVYMMRILFDTIPIINYRLQYVFKELLRNYNAIQTSVMNIVNKLRTLLMC